MPDTITLTRSQLRRLLERFAAELDARGGQIPESELDDVASRLLEGLTPSCQVSKSSRMLNSNVVIKIG
jgi:hypothetical protein